MDALLGLAISMPVTSMSENVAECAAAELLVLSIVKVKVERSPNETDAGENDLLNPGRSEATVRSAVALPLLPSLEVRSPLTLLCVPTTELVTSTEILQLWKPAKRPSSKVIVDPPAGATNAPVQVSIAFADCAITTPAGRLSTNAIELTEVASLVILNTNWLVLPIPIEFGLNAFVKTGAAKADALSNSASAPKSKLLIIFIGRLNC